MYQQADQTRLIKNSILLYIRMLVTTLIGLFSSRAILKGLGFEDYGLYNVVGGLVMLIAFVRQSMGNATWRYITVELGKGDSAMLNKTFNIALQLHVVFCLLLLIVAETIGLWFLFHRMVIPPGKEMAVFWVYQFSIITVIGNVMSSPYNSLVIAHEHMDAFAYITVYEAVSRLLCALSLVWFSHRLVVFAAMMLVVQLTINLFYFVYCRTRYPESKLLNIRDRKLMGEMSNFTGYTLLPGLGFALCDQGLNVLLNIFFGPAVNAARGISMQVRVHVNQFTDSFLKAVNPQITKLHASNELQSMHDLVSKTAKFSYFLMLFVVVPLMLKMEVFLTLWLGSYPEFTASFCRMILCVGVLETVAYPFLVGVAADGRIKVYYVVTGIMLVAVVPIAYIVLQMGYSPVAVYVVHFGVSILILLWRVAGGARLIGYRMSRLWKGVLIPCLRVSMFVALICMALYHFFGAYNLLDTVLVTLLSFVLTASAVYAVGMTAGEREFVRNRASCLLCR